MNKQRFLFLSIISLLFFLNTSIHARDNWMSESNQAYGEQGAGAQQGGLVRKPVFLCRTIKPQLWGILGFVGGTERMPASIERKLKNIYAKNHNIDECRGWLASKDPSYAAAFAGIKEGEWLTLRNAAYTVGILAILGGSALTRKPSLAYSALAGFGFGAVSPSIASCYTGQYVGFNDIVASALGWGFAVSLLRCVYVWRFTPKQEACSHDRDHAPSKQKALEKSPLFKPPFNVIAVRAFQSTTSITIQMNEIALLVHALTKVVQEDYPDLDPDDAIKLTTDAISLRCPNCGALSEQFLADLCIAPKGGFRSGDIGQHVTFMEPNITTSPQCECPGCKGTTVEVTFDPSNIDYSISPYLL